LNRNILIESESFHGSGNEKLSAAGLPDDIVILYTKNLNSGIFWSTLKWKFVVIFVTFYGQLVYFVVFWYIFPRFGILCHEKSGNPDTNLSEVQNFTHTQE
jgi:hypothetical protein